MRLQNGWRTMAVVSMIGLLAAGCGSGESADEQNGNSSSPKAATSLTPVAPQKGMVDFRKAEPGSGEGMKLGFIALGESVPFSKLVTDGMREQAKAAGAELVVCDSQLDGAKALDCAKNFKSQGVEGYLNFQVDAAAAASICAAGPDVPVIAVDIEQKPCQVAFVGAQNDYAGYLAGRAVGEYALENFDCEYDAFVSMEGPGAGAVNEARMGGYRKGFTEACGEIKNLRKVNADRLDVARTQFTDVLTALPGAKHVIVVGINDDAVLGALAAAKTAGRDQDVYLSGQGADPSAWCEIKNNPQWIGDTGYFPERYAEIGIPYLIDLVDGKDVPEQLFVPHEIITGDNIDDVYDVKDC